jgi:hypothetical protein
MPQINAGSRPSFSGAATVHPSWKSVGLSQFAAIAAPGSAKCDPTIAASKIAAIHRIAMSSRLGRESLNTSMTDLYPLEKTEPCPVLNEETLTDWPKRERRNTQKDGGSRCADWPSLVCQFPKAGSPRLHILDHPVDIPDHFRRLTAASLDVLKLGNDVILRYGTLLDERLSNRGDPDKHAGKFVMGNGICLR